MVEAADKKDIKPRQSGFLRWVPALIVLVAVCVVIVVALLPLWKKRKDALPPQPVNVTVERVSVIPTVWDTFELNGDVEPNNIVKVAAEVEGRIERYGEFVSPTGRRSGRPLDEGDWVKAGTPIVYLNTDLLKAAHKQAKARHEFDERDYDRILQAKKRDVATQKDVDQARTNLEVSKATLEEVKAKLDRTTILAPVSGIVNRLPMEVGEYVRPGDCCAQIVDTDTVKVVVNVPERDIGYLKVGQEQEIFDRLGRRFSLTGRISYISEVAEPAARTTRVEIAVPNRDRKLRSGQIVAVRLRRQKLKNVIMVPLDAVIPLEEGYMVYVVDDGEARPIRTIEIDISSIKGKRIRVTAGLTGGERLILSPGNRRCGPRQAVRVLGEEPSGATSQAAAEQQKQEK